MSPLHRAVPRWPMENALAERISVSVSLVTWRGLGLSANVLWYLLQRHPASLGVVSAHRPRRTTEAASPQEAQKIEIIEPFIQEKSIKTGTIALLLTIRPLITPAYDFSDFDGFFIDKIITANWLIQSNNAIYWFYIQ